MIHEKWFISDTHFFHENILKFFKDEEQKEKLRPFVSISEMHETIIEKWNKLIKPNDYVYHLGDVTFKYDRSFIDLMFRLNGRKRMCVGNHDRLGFQHMQAYTKVFEKIAFWKGFKEYNFTATHFPLRLDSLRDGKFCVHGHTHHNLMKEPNYINVCVETRDYTPVHLETILKEIKERS